MKLTMTTGKVMARVNLLPWQRRNIPQAHAYLNMQVVADSSKFIPFRDGALRQSATYPNGIEGNDIEWNTPYAHYQYMGEVYINPKHNASGFIGKDGMWHGWRGAKVPSGRPIEYHTEGTGDHWFDKAAEAYLPEWVEGVAKIMRSRR